MASIWAARILKDVETELLKTSVPNRAVRRPVDGHGFRFDGEAMGKPVPSPSHC
jgi:hypothetical protein